MRRTVKKGFTLIELLIVVVIIGILAAIAIPKFANTKQKATLAAAKTDLRNLVSAEEGYFADKGAYTTVTTAAGLNLQSSKGVGAPTITLSGSGYEANVTLTADATKKCSVAVNGATNSVDATAIEGAPACTP
jgi:type IV pilus assembly protein PilA